MDGKPSWRKIRISPEIKNFGSNKRPKYTIQLDIYLFVEEDPDTLHEIFIKAGLISRETIPLESTTNFRGSLDNKPFYEAIVEHESTNITYRVNAEDTGGASRTKVYYESIIEPEELRFIHPTEFKSLGIRVLGWDLRNYRHHPTLLGLLSGKYEIFSLSVSKREFLSSVDVTLREPSLKSLKIPCEWYFNKLNNVFDIEKEVVKKLR